MKKTLSVNQVLLLMLMAAMAGYGAHYIVPPWEPSEAGKAASTVAIETDASEPGDAAVLLSHPTAAAEAPNKGEEITWQAAAPSDGAPVEDSERHYNTPDDPADQSHNPFQHSGLDPDYEAYLEQVEAREEAEDAAEPEPEKPVRLTREEIDALDEEELRLEAETYNAYLADLAAEYEWRRWEDGPFEGEPHEE